MPASYQSRCRSAEGELYPARYELKMSMTASLSSLAQQMFAVDISELHTKLVTGKEGSKLIGVVYTEMSGTT